MINRRIIETASLARHYLDAESRREVIRFVRGCWNADGGARGRGGACDLYYTFFAVMCLRTLRGRIPLFRLYRYLKAFGDGESLDMAHLFCLLQLRSIFPGANRTRLLSLLESRDAETPYDHFLKTVAAQQLGGGGAACGKGGRKRGANNAQSGGGADREFSHRTAE